MTAVTKEQLKKASEHSNVDMFAPDLQVGILQVTFIHITLFRFETAYVL